MFSLFEKLKKSPWPLRFDALPKHLYTKFNYLSEKRQVDTNDYSS